MRRHLTGVPPAVAAGGQLTAAALLLAPFALVTSLVDGFDATPRRIGAVAAPRRRGDGRRLPPVLPDHRRPRCDPSVARHLRDPPRRRRRRDRRPRRDVRGAAARRRGVDRRRHLPRQPLVPAEPPGARTGHRRQPAGGGGARRDDADGLRRRQRRGRRRLHHRRRVGLRGRAPRGPRPSQRSARPGRRRRARVHHRSPDVRTPRARLRMLSGNRDEPLSRPNQVGHLEAGGVLLQYAPDLDRRAGRAGSRGWPATASSSPRTPISRLPSWPRPGSSSRPATRPTSTSSWSSSAPTGVTLRAPMADSWGIEDGYWDVGGTWHDTPETTRRRLRVAMGGLADVDDPPPAGRPVWFVRHGTPAPTERPAEVVLEDGTSVLVDDALPPDLPLGYHDLHPSDGGPTTRLIVVPDRCAPAPERTAGWTIQLYAARSSASWGIGDLADLASLTQWATATGAGFVALSPLHAPLPVESPEPSPYFASSPSVAEPAAPAARARGRLGPVRSRPGRARRPRSGARRRPAHRSDGGVGGEAGGADPALAGAAGRGGHGSRVLRLRGRRAVRRWAATPPSAPWPSTTARAGARGRSSTGAPRARPSPASPPPTPMPSPSTPGCSGSSTGNWSAPRPAPRSSTTSPSAPPRTGSTRGRGRTASPTTSASARRPTSSTPPARTGGSRRSCRGGSGPLGYEPLAELFRGAFAHGAGLRVDHVMGLFRLWWIPDDTGDSGVAKATAATSGSPAPSSSTCSPSRAPAPAASSSVRTSERSRTRFGPRSPSATSCPTGWPGSRRSRRRTGRSGRSPP